MSICLSLFAIADLHLSHGVDKPMDDFSGWDGYVRRLEENWRSVVADTDTVVVAGDISWGMSFGEAREDFAFLDALPGQKLLIKGNHDYWWSTRRKMDDFFAASGFSTLRIVHNDAVAVTEELAVCGTRGWFFDAEADADRKVLLREAGRLQASIAAACKMKREPLVFLHYPPVCGGTFCDEIWQVLRDNGVRRCYYGHLHGPAIRRAAQGMVQGIGLTLISGDSLSFMPKLIERY